MQASAEIRWFKKGSIPNSATQWFELGEIRPIAEPIKTDSYLRVMTPELGIKVRSKGGRDEKLEVKGFLSDLGSIALPNGGSGLGQLWARWNIVKFPHQSGLDWIDVRKARRIRKWEVDARGSIMAVPVDELPLPPQGCNLELSQLSLGAEEWWTVGFDAFGALNRVEEILKIVVDQIATDEFPLLTSGDSVSYPAWLEKRG